MKGLLVSLVTLVVLLVAADRIALVIVERQVAAQLQTTGSLSSRPDVSVGGFPFLTQALSGRYDDVELSASEVAAGGGRLSRLSASLRGVHVSLSSALSGSVTTVPVDSVQATVLMTYADIDAQLRDRGLSVSPVGSLLRVTGKATVLGRTVSASAVSSVAFSGTSLVVSAQRFQVGNSAADRVLTAGLAGRFDFRVRIGRLPYGLKINAVRVTPDGLIATAVGTNTVLHR
ncbi:MAG: DUF2993 domain-containing protein [Mycobacteriales bacterium]